eukprot:1258541-Pyramimonas_sp.AAC.2
MDPWIGAATAVVRSSMGARLTAGAGAVCAGASEARCDRPPTAIQLATRVPRYPIGRTLERVGDIRDDSWATKTDD